jgi:hypothetical protein
VLRSLVGFVLVMVIAFFAIVPPSLVGSLVDVVFSGDSSWLSRQVTGFVAIFVPSLPDMTQMEKLWVFATLFLIVRLAAFFIEWANGYLLALLWDELAPHFAALALPPEGEAADLALPPPRALRRVSAGWRPDAAAVAALSESPDLASAAMAADAPDPLDGAEAAAVGTAAHLLLEHLARDGELSAADARLDTMTPLLHRRLARLGLAPAGAQRATERALALVRTSLRDADCRWLLSAHPVSRSEWPLGEAGPAGSAVHIIDRYFETTEGERWIIDYKTDTPPRDVAQAEFIAQRMEAHRPQLERYRRLASELDPRPLRLAIYFLALPALVELSA